MSTTRDVTNAQLLVGGSWRPSLQGRMLETHDPATGELLAVFADADAADVDAAVAAARKALVDEAWRDITPSERGRLLFRMADLVEDRADELAELETRDQGQPLGVARNVSVANAIETLRYFAGWTTKLGGETMPPATVPGVFQYTRREPVGVCGLIIPWNFPLMIAVWKLAPALACGNAVLLKPAEQTPLTAVVLGEIVEEAGIPAGVVNVLTGGPDTGRAIVDHPQVDKVSFTGSVEVGREIVKGSTGNLKRVSLELGGKTASIVLADADLEEAAQVSLQAGLGNSGQICAAYTRLFVDRSRAEEFGEVAAGIAEAMTIGPGLTAGTDLGPLVSEEQRQRVESYVKIGQDEGATLLTGGSRPSGAGLDEGWFYQPTLFGEVKDEMRIAREEIFGPVLAILPYDEPEEIVARANDTEFGLGAAIWTRDVGRAHRLAAELRAGTVWVNMGNAIDPVAPWGGLKASGWGREMGAQALDAYTETKSVWVSLA